MKQYLKTKVQQLASYIPIQFNITSPGMHSQIQYKVHFAIQLP